MSEEKFYANALSGIIGLFVGLLGCGLYLHIPGLIGIASFAGALCCIIRAAVANVSGE